jgi:hypothetical protein
MGEAESPTLYDNVFDVKGRGILHGKEWLAVRDKI